MKVTLYSTGCPKCNVLKLKLKEANIQYDEISNVDIMIQKGFMSTPMLEIDNKILNYNESINWINSRKAIK